MLSQHYLFTHRDCQSRLLPLPLTGQSSWVRTLEELNAEIASPNSTSLSAVRNIDVLAIIDRIEKYADSKNRQPSAAHIDP